jgi:osmotically inducible lipoprotein OsmB
MVYPAVPDEPEPSPRAATLKRGEKAANSGFSQRVRLICRRRNKTSKGQKGVPIMSRLSLAGLIFAASLLTGCGYSPGHRALTGGAIGAGGGAIIGSATGMGAGTGALIGAGVGAATGAATSHNQVNLGD